MLIDPVRTRRWPLETRDDAVAGIFDTILIEKVLLGYNTSNVNALKVTHTTAGPGGRKQIGELGYGNRFLADCPIVEGIWVTWEDIIGVRRCSNA